MRSVALLLLASLTLSACMGARYLPQAGAGQLSLMLRGQRLERAVADPETPPEIAHLLSEVPRILAFARREGLEPSHSYQRYVALDRDAVVWLVTGSHPLAFTPKVYWFPIVGSFAGVGWFDVERAERHVARLQRQGWDATARGASAYSTGGWFRDPVVTSMFVLGPTAVGELANVLLHETLHATVLVPGQTYFDESLASFVADQMTPAYLAERFGPDAPELVAYRAAAARQRERQAQVLATYQRLEILYASDQPDTDKLREKARILAALARELGLQRPPNNASLLGAKLYGSGQDELDALLATCDGDWPRFLRAVGSLRPRDFAAPQREDFTPVIDTLIAWNCSPLR